VPVPSAIVARCTQTIQVAVKTNVDAYGEKTAPSTVTYKARVERGRKRVWVRGEEVFSNVRVYVPQDIPGITPEAVVTLDDGTAPPMKDVLRNPWPTGGYSIEMVF
jgi:hypothetical protein